MPSPWHTFLPKEDLALGLTWLESPPLVAVTWGLGRKLSPIKRYIMDNYRRALAAKCIWSWEHQSRDTPHLMCIRELKH